MDAKLVTTLAAAMILGAGCTLAAGRSAPRAPRNSARETPPTAPARRATTPPPRTLTPEIAESLVQASDAAISPDGRHVLYRLSVADTEERDRAEARYALWLSPTAGGDARQLVAADSNPSSATWSPDGQWIAFLSSRRVTIGKGGSKDGDDEPPARVHVMRLDGGEARPLTPETLPVLGYRWAPDSTALAFIAKDAESQDRKAAKKKGEDWTEVDALLLARRLRRVALASGEVHDLTDAALAVWDVDWSPDGKSLVAAVTDRPRTDDQYVRQRLVVVPAGGGEPRPLVPARGKLESPRWSPDGKTIAWLGGLDVHDPLASTVHVVPADGGAPRAVAAGAAASLRRLEWVAADRLAVSGEEGVRSVLAVLSLDGSSQRLLERGLVFSGFSVTGDGTRFAIAASTPDMPAEVFLVGSGLETPKRITFGNEVLETLSLGEQGPFAWTAGDGTPVEGVLIRPAGFQAGRKYPLLVTPHGGPESASVNGWQASYVYLGQVAAARGWLVLLPNYRGSIGRGEAYARANHGDLGGAEFQDVLDGVDALVAAGLADPARVAIAGGSYGGYFAAWGATRHTDRFAAAVVFAGITNWVSFTGTSDIPEENTFVHWGFDDYIPHLDLLWSRSPLAHVARARTPTLILHGEKDDRVSPSQGMELYTALRLRGVPVSLVTYPRQGHALRERAHRLDASRRVLAWLERYGGGAGREEGKK